MSNYTRYSVIHEKNPREIVMLRGSGCQWKRCRFCDYHFDFSKKESENYALNLEQLRQVTGKYHTLEVINSGSFTDLDSKTLDAILQTCIEKKITQIHFECHWMHREEVASFRHFFETHNITVKLKIGVETFDYLFRESYLAKGIDTDDPKQIACYFNEVCLLFGLPGQTIASMQKDISIGLTHFERVCINIMQKNTKPILPDPSVIQAFIQEIYPLYMDNPRVDILLNNIDFGVGELEKEN